MLRAYGCKTVSGCDARGQPVVLVLGENGRDLALHCGLPEAALVKVGNWVGTAAGGCR